jgi:hypothetical protein
MLQRLRARTEWKFFSVLPKADGTLAVLWWILLMIPGAVLLLLAFRQFLSVNALVFTVGILLTALGMQKTFGYERTPGVLPLAMVVPAIALVQCWGTLFAGRRRWLRWLRNAGLFASIVLCVAANLQIYFGIYGRWLHFGDETSEMGWVAG